MSITDELKGYTEEQIKWLDMTKVHYRKLLAIADRIDAEHEAMLVDARKTVYQGYIELPKDADGEYIHVGDVMEWALIEDDGLTIVREVSAVGNGVFFAWSDEQHRYAQYESHVYRHHHAQTVEDVLREFALAVCKDDALTIRSGVVEEFAKRLKLAGDAS